MPFALPMEPLDAAWSILKRQRPHPSRAAQQPKNVFDNEMNQARIKDAEKKNEIRRLQEKLANRVPPRRGNEGAMRRYRKKMAQRLQALQAKDEPEEETQPNVDPAFETSLRNILGIGDDYSSVGNRGEENPTRRMGG